MKGLIGSIHKFSWRRKMDPDDDNHNLYKSYISRGERNIISFRANLNLLINSLFENFLSLHIMIVRGFRRSVVSEMVPHHTNSVLFNCAPNLWQSGVPLPTSTNTPNSLITPNFSHPLFQPIQLHPTHPIAKLFVVDIKITTI